MHFSYSFYSFSKSYKITHGRSPGYSALPRIWLFLFLAMTGVIVSPLAAQRSTVGPEEPAAWLDTLMRSHDYFALRDSLFQPDGSARRPPYLGAAQWLLLTGVLRNKLLDFAGSDRDLAAFLKSGRSTLRDRALVAQLRGDNAAKTLRYADAASWYSAAVHLADSLSAAGDSTPRRDSAMEVKREDLTSDAQLWRALAGLRPQRLHAATAVHLSAQRDRAGLLRLPVQLGDEAHSVDAVFDTGADVTTLALSVADAIGVSYPNKDSLLVAGVAALTWGRVAVIRTMHIGQATATNVPVLVLPDSSLMFPAAHYAIQMILGLPVIRAFGHVTISADGALVFGPPAASSPACESSQANLMLDGLKLLVDATASGRTGAYTFDTGASATMFYPRFGTTHAALVAAATRSHERFGGAGGSAGVDALVIGHVDLAIGGSAVQLSKVPLLGDTGPLTPGSHVEGNLGQDVLRGLGAVAIDFDSCTISAATSPRIAESRHSR